MSIKSFCNGVAAILLVATALFAPQQLFAAISDTPVPFDITSANDFIETIATDGEILYVGGAFSTINGTARQGFAAFDIETQELLPLDLELDGGVYSILLDGGTIYLGGDFTDVNNGTERRGLASFSTTTGIATAFDPHIEEGSVSALLLDGDILYAGGDFSCIGDFVESCDEVVRRNSLAAFDTTTGLLTDFDPSIEFTGEGGGQASVNAFEIYEDILYVGGSFDTVNGDVSRANLAGFDTTTATGTVEAIDFGAIDDNVVDLLVHSNLLYASGNFTTVNEATTRNGLAVFNLVDGFFSAGQSTSYDPDLTGGTPAKMYRDATDDTLYVVGFFDTVNGDVARSYMAAFDDDGVVTDFAPVFDDGIGEMVVDDEGNVYVAGSFTQAGGQAAGGIAYFEVFVDEDAPTVESLTPADNTADLNAVTFEEAVIVFNEAVELSGDEGPALGLYNAADDSEVENALVGEIDGDTVTLALQFPLDAGASYYILIDDGYFQDLAGNPFAGITASTTWNFSFAEEAEEVDDEEESSGGGGGSSSHRRSDSSAGNMRDPILLLMQELVGLLQQLLEQLIAERGQ